jgi:hypothetical protein
MVHDNRLWEPHESRGVLRAPTPGWLIDVDQLTQQQAGQEWTGISKPGADFMPESAEWRTEARELVWKYRRSTKSFRAIRCCVTFGCAGGEGLKFRDV